jgi:hypothetical protein
MKRYVIEIYNDELNAYEFYGLYDTLAEAESIAESMEEGYIIYGI